MVNRKLLFLFLLLCVFTAQGQSLKKYSFNKYSAKVSATKKKATIDYNSHKIAKQYKTVITDAYKSGKINFGGHYIVCTWGCGVGCLDGAMVDVETGKVYKLPMGESRNYTGCVFAPDEDCIEFTENSRLFITQICIQNKSTSTNDIQEKEYFVNVWNEKQKKFNLVENLKTTKSVQAD